MPLSVPRILVIDDIEEDGIKIAKSVWNSQFAIRFIHYDQEELIKAGKENMRGVRLIFMDMNLIGDGILGSGSKNFTAVQQVLQFCLDERNGPYVLITWSTFDTYAPGLFKHLNERLPVSLRPSLCKQLNKEEYEDGDGRLTEKIKEYMQELEAIGALISWEKTIQYAACETLYDLIGVAIASGIDDVKDALRSVLFSLASAAAEQNLDKTNAVKHLYSVLSQILYDNLANALPEEEAAQSELIYSGKDLKPKEPWSQKIHTMLHLDLTEPDPLADHMPGDVFPYPGKDHGLPIPDLDVCGFLRGGKFMPRKKEEDEEIFRARIEKDCKLALVEITALCDYSQKKSIWHRYLAAAIVPNDFVKNSRLPDFIWPSPEFQIGNDPPFKMLFNSLLIMSIPKEFRDKLKRIFRIRQPLLGDTMGWLARQSSRQGHISVM